MNRRLSAVIAISLVCAGLFVFNQSVKSDTTSTFNLVSGTDNTNGAQRALTPREVAKLSVSDNSRIQTDGNWSMTGAYDETKYLEFVFTPNIPASASVSSVAVTHEFYRSSAMATAKLEIWDGTAWHDVVLALPHASGTVAEISETKDITSLVPIVAALNGIKIRFLAYRNDIVQSGLKTSHDLVQLSVNYILPTSTPNMSDSVLPTDMAVPSETATPLVIDASSSFTPAPAVDTSTPSPIATPTLTPIFIPTPIFTPFVSFAPDPETTPDPHDLTASVSMPLIASRTIESPTPSPTASPSLSPTPEATATPAVLVSSTPNPLIASLVKPRAVHRKATPLLSVTVLPSAQPLPPSRFTKVRTTVVDIWHELTQWLRMIKR